MIRIERIIVAIPARNEAERLPAALDAIHAASGMCDVPVAVVVAADACTDDTADVARAGGARVVTSAAGRVGAARAAAIRAGLRRTETDPDRIWIANTDADSVVPLDWLAVHLDFADRGAALLLGAVRPDPRELAAWQRRRWRSLHPRAESHDHVHGANLGLTASAYLAVDGFRDVPLREDVELVRAVQSAGHLVVSTARAPVVTSARPVGRLEGGFATYLSEFVLRPAGP